MSTPTRIKKPPWLRVRPPSGENYKKIQSMLHKRTLYTVCEEARCPNIGECWAGGTATIMVMGDTCTRGCRFCNVKSGNPNGYLDPKEPVKVAQSLKEMSLEYVVITTVDRDDLPDQGAQHFARIIKEVKKQNPKLLVEALAGDFQGNSACLHTLLDSGLEVYSHNVETVERLTPKVRDRRATYLQSLSMLEEAKKYSANIVTKSSIMLGLGEERHEVIKTMQDVRNTGAEIFTLGQYLQPSSKHLAVSRYVLLEEFQEYETIGKEMGYAFVASGPLVRSSYRAGEYFLKSFLKERLETNKQMEKIWN